MLPQKILKIKYLRLAKNAFPKILNLYFWLLNNPYYTAALLEDPRNTADVG